MEPAPRIQHNIPESRFETIVDGQISVADYSLEGDRMIFTHTFVPPVLRGRGIAEKLVRAALDYARIARMKVDPQCSYVALFLQRHKEYRDLTLG